MRIIDCLLYEGQKVLYRVAIAIVQLYHRQRKMDTPSSSSASPAKLAHMITTNGKNSIQDVARDIAHFCAHITVSPDKLLKVRRFCLSRAK